MSAPYDPTRAAVEALRQAVTPGPDDFEHVPSALLDALALGALGNVDDVEREIAEGHLADCAQCAEDLADRVAVQTAIMAGRTIPHSGGTLAAAVDAAVEDAAVGTASLARPRGVLMMAGVLAAAAALVLVVWTTRRGEAPSEQARTAGQAGARPGARRDAPTGGATERAADTAADTAVDTSQRTSTARHGSTEGSAAHALTPEEQAVVARVLAAGRVELPGDAQTLAGRVGTLLGREVSQGPFGPLAPRGTVVVSARPTLTWRAEAQAMAYTVRIFDERFAEVASERVAGTAWTPAADLPRGATYSWQVTAHRAEGDVTAPAPPQPEALFRVATSAAATAAAEQAQRLAADPLALGILQASAGMVSEATVSFERATSMPALRGQAVRLKASLGVVR